MSERPLQVENYSYISNMLLKVCHGNIEHFASAAHFMKYVYTV